MEIYQLHPRREVKFIDEEGGDKAGKIHHEIDSCRV